MKLCSVKTCSNKYIAKNFCNKHYLEFKKYGLIRPINTCLVIGCNNKYNSKGYCRLHYIRLRNHNNTDKPVKTYKNRLCDIDGCDKKHKANGLCENHYASKWNRDNPEIVKRNNKIWTSKNPEKILSYNIKSLSRIGKTLNMNSMEYQYAQQSWSIMIRKLDNKTCKNCNSKEKLHAHHIMPKSLFPKLALDVNNGITLCETCHRNIHE